MLLGMRTGAWAKSGEKPLPYDKEVEWFGFDTTSGVTVSNPIRIFFKPTLGLSFSTEVKIDSVGSYFGVFSGYTSSYGYPALAIGVSSLRIGKTNSSYQTISHQVDYGKWCKYDVNYEDGEILVDGVFVGSISATSLGSSFYFPYVTSKSKGYIKNLVISKNGVVLFSAIPVVKNNTPYWFDKITGNLILEFRPQDIPYIIIGPDKTT